MSNEGGSIDDDAEADESAGHGVIGVIGVGSDVADADAAAGNGVFVGGANVGVVGKNVGDAGAAANGFFASSAGPSSARFKIRRTSALQPPTTSRQKPARNTPGINQL